MNSMLRSNRVLRVCCTLLLLSLTGCVPAHYVQRPKAPKPCEMRVCTSFGTGFERCECKRFRDVEAQMQGLVPQDVFGP